MSGIRVYPIRMTRKEWHIGLFAIHECTHGCNYVLVKDRKNKRYKCKASEVCQNNETIDTEQLARIIKIAGLGTSLQIYPKTDLPLLLKSQVGQLGTTSIYVKTKNQIEEDEFKTEDDM